MRVVEAELSASDKILLAISELNKKRVGGEKITKEDMVVKVWEMFPEDFCIKGHPQYPNADISKYVTKLFKENLLKGSFYNYILTLKGEEYAESIRSGNKPGKKEMVLSASRQIESEIRRIKDSKIFQLFLNGEKDFLESDLFEFLGTSSRSLNGPNRTAFTAKYNFVVKEVIPFCESIKHKDQETGEIAALSKILILKFTDILNKKSK